MAIIKHSQSPPYPCPQKEFQMKRYILTGTPGSGKTTLLHALNDHGYDVVEEAATDIIHSEQLLGNKEPWTDPSFIIKILELQLQQEFSATTASVDILYRPLLSRPLSS